MNSVNISLINHKTLKIKNNETKIFKKSFVLIMICLAKQFCNIHLFVYLVLYTIPFIEPESSKRVQKVHPFMFVK